MPLESPDLTEFTTASPIQATYDYLDTPDGTAYIDFFGVIRETSTGDTFGLTRSTAASRGVAAIRLLDNVQSPYNMDSASFNSSRTVKGKINILGSLFHTSAGLAVDFRVYHLRGGTETAISASVTTQTSTDSEAINIELDLTETKFITGDQIRIIVTVPAVAGANLACDPSGEYQSLNPLKFRIPFKVVQ